MHIIYGLVDPNNGQLRYIGYTSYPKKRYSHHLTTTYLKTHKNNWIKSLLLKNQKPEMIILEQYMTAQELPQAEIELIEYYKYIGCDLTNGTNGGDGIMLGRHHTIETKQKMSMSQHRHSVSLDTRNKISQSHKGKLSPRRGTKVSSKSLIKMSNAHLGNTIWLGKHHSGISKEKISIANKDRYKDKTWKLINGKRVWMEK